MLDVVLEGCCCWSDRRGPIEGGHACPPIRPGRRWARTASSQKKSVRVHSDAAKKQKIHSKLLVATLLKLAYAYSNKASF